MYVRAGRSPAPTEVDTGTARHTGLAHAMTDVVRLESPGARYSVITWTSPAWTVTVRPGKLDGRRGSPWLMSVMKRRRPSVRRTSSRPRGQPPGAAKERALGRVAEGHGRGPCGRSGWDGRFARDRAGPGTFGDPAGTRSAAADAGRVAGGGEHGGRGRGVGAGGNVPGAAFAQVVAGDRRGRRPPGRRRTRRPAWPRPGSPPRSRRRRCRPRRPARRRARQRTAPVVARPGGGKRGDAGFLPGEA